MLADGETPVRIAAAKGLGQLGNRRAAEALATRLDSEDFDLRMSASIALMQLGDPRGVESISKCLKDADAKRRERAITELIGFSNDESLTAPLIEALEDPSIRVRLYAAGFLGRLRNRAATDALLAKVTDRENLRAVLQGLSQTRDDRALAILINHLDDDDLEIRQTAAYGIAAFGEKDGVQPLLQHLKDESPDMRIALIRALSTLEASEAVEAISEATDDDDVNVRSQAERTLRKLQTN
jgi:HEAT repeat protein